MSICSQCGAVLRPQAKFCNVCGYKAAQLTPQALLPAVPNKKTVLMSSGTQNTGVVQLIFDDGQIVSVQSPMMVGRDSTQCDFAISDERVSSSHARLEEQGGQWILTDLNSSNGTFINNARITSLMPLNAGDQIRFGNTICRFDAPGQMPSASPLYPVPAILPAALPSAVATPGGLGGPGLPDPWQAAPSGQVMVPAGGWRQWPKSPNAEGAIEYKSDRYTMKKNDLLKKGCIAVFLGVLFTPLAMMIPFITGSDDSVIDFRLRDAHTGLVVDIKVIGDMLGNMEQGDVVAIWGKNQNGMLTARQVHNYTSGTDFKIKK